LATFSADFVEVTTPWLSGVRDPKVVVHSSIALPKSDVTVVAAIPVTSVARTLIDLAGLVVREELPAETVAIALDDAIRSRKASLKWLESRVKELRQSGRPGIVFMEELLAARRGVKVPESVFETRALHLLASAGFPRPVCQYEVFDGDLFVARVDFAYPHIKLAIEADGFAFHSTPADLERDGARSNALQSLGWDLLHLTWGDLERPELFLRSLGRYLRAG
jgi:hypothetical protein